MKRIAGLILLIAATTASGQSIPADVAAGRKPRPTWTDVHTIFTRIVINESGWKSTADVGGILQVHLYNSGGRSEKRASTYGIDYRRFINFSARVAARTFPPNSPWIRPISVEKHETWQKAYGNPYWTSTVKLDCSEPAHWSEVNKEPWKNYEERCKTIVKLTAEYLKGEHPTWCRTLQEQPADPQFWGSNDDAKRPEVKSWEELTCNDPSVDCSKDKSSGSCAKNRWFRLPRK